MLKDILKDLQRQINKMKVKGIKNLNEAPVNDLKNYIILFKKLDVARHYEKEILNIKSNYEVFLEAEKTMHEWYDKQIKELESVYDRKIGENLFTLSFEQNKLSDELKNSARKKKSIIQGRYF